MRQTTSKSNRINPILTRYTPCRSAISNHTNIDNHSHINCNSNYTSSSKAYLNNSNNNNSNDLYCCIQSLWNDLGVRIPYRTIYESIASQLGSQMQSDFYDLELNSLKKFSECLTKNAQEITNREKAIFLLQKLDQVLGNNLKEEGSNVNDNIIINDIIQTIKNIRVYSVNVVFQMNKIRELCSYSTVSGKYDLDKLNNEFLFNRNYLIKMRFDLDFLFQSNLSLMFNFAENSDPFLQAVAFDSSNDNKIITVPIDEDIGQAIHQCQYIIMQDLIYYQMQLQEQQQESKEQGGEYSMALEKKVVMDYNKTPIDKIIKEDNYKGKGGKGSSSANNPKRPAKIERECIPSVSKDELMRKMEEYDLLKKNLEMDREIIGKRKVDMNKNKKLNDDNHNLDEEGDNDDDDDDEEKKKKKNDKSQAESNAINVKNLQDEINKNEQKTNDNHNDNDNDLDEEIIIDWNVIDNQEIKKDKKEEEVIKVEPTLTTIENNKDKNVKEPIDEDINQDTQQNEYKEELTQNLKINEEKIKLNQPIITNSPQHNINSSHLKSSTSNINEIHQTPRRYDSPQYSPQNSLNTSLRRSMTPKTHAKHLQKSLKMVYYTNNITDFIPIYSNYYCSIPIEQLIIFHINPNPIQSILSSYSPKILFCMNNNKKQKQDIIKGLCIFCFDIENDAAIKVNIIHLSSIKNNEETIIAALIEHIKTTVYCNEINIDLYYKFEESKFTINKELRDLFKDSLGFRWSKLENLAEHVRYQKMYLKTIQDGSYRDDYTRIIPLPSIQIKEISVISIVDNKNNADNQEDNRFDKYINLFTVVYLLNWLKNNNSSLYTIESISNNTTDLNWEITSRDTINNNLKCYMDNYYNTNQLLIDNEINNLLPQRKFISNYLSNTLLLNPSFMSNISGMINNIHYNRIQGQIKTIKHSEYDQLFYLIPTIDGNNSIVFAEINSKTKENLIEKNGNIYELFNSYYNKLEPIEDENEKDDIVIWVPSFEIETHLLTKNIQSLQNIIIKKNNEQLYINGIDEYLKINYGNNHCYDHNNYNTSSLSSSFIIKPNKEDIIIKDSFIFGLVNYNILSSFAFSTILLLNITKDHWKFKRL